MRLKINRFTSERAMAVFEQIEKVLHERGGASTWDLALTTGLSQNRVGEFLREMQRHGTAECIEPAGKYQGGTLPAKWGPGRSSSEIDEERDDAPRRVTVLTQWAPNHRRDLLDCYLFGAPAVLGMAA